MRRSTLLGGLVGLLMALTLVSTAAADPSPNGPGHPGAPNTTCQQYTVTPGNAASSQSPFNPAGRSGQVYAPLSQYDIACFQATSH